MTAPMLKRLAAVALGGWLVASFPGAGLAQAVPETAPAPSRATVTAERLRTVLRLDEIAEVIAAEAVAQAAEPARPDHDLQQAIAAEVTPHRIQALTIAALERGLAATSSTTIAPAVRFLESPLGQRYVTLQLSARRAMADPTGKKAALAGFDRAAARGEPRVGQIRRLVAAGDMVAPAVASSMGASLAFMRGLNESGAASLPEKDLLALIWSQEPALQAEHQGWVEAFLYLALGPLSDPEVDRLIREADRPASRRLDVIVQTAFDTAMMQIMRDTGRAVGLAPQGQSL